MSLRPTYLNRTSDSGSLTGICVSRRPLIALNRAVLAPMPSASEITTTVVQLFAVHSRRTAWRRSFSIVPPKRTPFSLIPCPFRLLVFSATCWRRYSTAMNVVETPACLNCGSPLTGPHCAHCGQKRPHTDLTFRELVREATQELAQWDGKIPDTLRPLFFKPGLLTVDFSGRPPRAVARAAARVSHLQHRLFRQQPVLEGVTARSARELAGIGVTNADGTLRLTPEMPQQVESGLPARIFGKDRSASCGASRAVARG